MCCGPRIEVILKLQKKRYSGGSGRGEGVQVGGCDPRIKVIVKMQKKSREEPVEGGSGVGVC